MVIQSPRGVVVKSQLSRARHTGDNLLVMLRVAAFITALLLLVGALASLPYGYFQALRVVVCTCAAYFACVMFASDGHSRWMGVMIVVAIVFNPFLPIYMPRSMWQVVDIVTAIVVVMTSFALKEPKSH